MHQTPEDLQRISAHTLAHYDRNAQAFWAGTRDHDVRQNINALLGHIEATPPFDILDFGCGPGRDLMALKTGGVLFCSNPRGDGEEGGKGDRFPSSPPPAFLVLWRRQLL